MNNFYVKIGKEKLKVDKKVFLMLMDLSPLKQYVSYQRAAVDDEIKLIDLKEVHIML